MLKRALSGLLIAILITATGQAAEDQGEALRLAASRGEVEAVRALLDAGVDPDAANSYGATPLIVAANKGHLEVIKLLVAKGADVNRKDTFYQFAPVMGALFSSHEDVVVFLIGNGLEDVDGVLPMAVGQGSVPVVTALLATGKLSAEALSGALVAAQRAEGGEEIVALLEKAGARPPPPSAFQLPPEALARYAGTYVLPDQGFESTVAIAEGALTVQLGGPPTPLEPTDATSFRAPAAGFTIRFKVEDEKVTGFTFERGDQTFEFTRKVEGEPAVAETAAPAAAVEAARPVIPPGAAARDWPSFRGPNAAGTAAGKPPLEWDVPAGENVLWKRAVPGRAHSSPIVWGDRLFVTTAVAAEPEGDFRAGLYGDVDSVEIKTEYGWRLYALDKKSGELVWERVAHEGKPRSSHHVKATQANPTPVTDGKHVVAVMGSEGIYCYDFDGNLEWKRDLGVLDVGWFYDASYQWGHSSSPVIHGDTVFVQIDRHGDPFIAAYALADGKELWRTPRDNMPSWGTPTLLGAGEGAELVTNGTSKVRAYDPATGKELWSLGPNSEVTVGTPVTAHGMVYVTGGYPPVQPIYAVKPGGRGDLSPEDGEHVAWSHDNGGTYMPTPLVYGDHLYTLSNSGVLTSYDAKTGERVYRDRAAGRGGVAFTASPVAAAGRLYLASESDGVFVIRAGARFERLAENQVGEVVMATPAISEDVIYLRSLEHVIAVGAKQ